MPHPDLGLLGYALKKIGVIIYYQIGLAELSLCGPGHLAAEIMSHQLHAVADAQDRDTELKNLHVRNRSTFLIDTGRSSRQYNTLRVEISYLLQGRIKGEYFGVYFPFPYSAR